jgi:hypothetical protein
MTNKRRKNSGKARETEEARSETSIGTQQLQDRAARSTENIFSQMLSRSK